LDAWSTSPATTKPPQKHLSWIALAHPEHELSEFRRQPGAGHGEHARQLEGVHRWALRFLEDRRLTAHGTLVQDLKRIEEQSAYALADAVARTRKKADALLRVSSRRIPAACSRTRRSSGPRLPCRASAVSTTRWLRGRASGRSNPGRPWFRGRCSPPPPIWRRRESWEKLLPCSSDTRRAIRSAGQGGIGWAEGEGRSLERPVYDEAQAQSALHDAAVLREARGELRQALLDRSLALELWTRPRTWTSGGSRWPAPGQGGRACAGGARMTAIARRAKEKPALQMAAWREAARFYASAQEIGTPAVAGRAGACPPPDRPKGAEKLPRRPSAPAEAHFALGASGFDSSAAEIRPPLMADPQPEISCSRA